jgi:YidC/Oxa1 family membrane protein insertase
METDVRLEGRSIPFSILLGPGMGPIIPDEQGDFAEPKASYYMGGSVERHTVDDLEEEAIRFEPGTRWVALESLFFAYLVVSPDGIRGGSITQTEFAGTGDDSAPARLLSAEVDMEAGAQYAAFLGPKAYEVLQAADVTLIELIDYGWFALLVRPLLFGLNFIYEYLHNYGWAIIVLTFGINAVLFPVRYKQMASMKKMSELQPQMKAIQDRYKKMKRTDPRRSKMNEEVMALYKKHGVNPLGGCLPLVIQMPFLFAFFRMLRSSIELRGASFIGWWIPDLSQPDIPLTILMGASMVVQQKMTPAAGDPTQRKMMMFLPVVFTFFFLSFSSGLVLYFLFSNLFGMMFQFLTQRWQQAAAAAPTKERAKKK